jgi:hypothetical protein
MPHHYFMPGFLPPHAMPPHPMLGLHGPGPSFGGPGPSFGGPGPGFDGPMPTMFPPHQLFSEPNPWDRPQLQPTQWNRGDPIMPMHPMQGVGGGGYMHMPLRMPEADLGSHAHMQMHPPPFGNGPPFQPSASAADPAWLRTDELPIFSQQWLPPQVTIGSPVARSIIPPAWSARGKNAPSAEYARLNARRLRTTACSCAAVSALAGRDRAAAQGSADPMCAHPSAGAFAQLSLPTPAHPAGPVAGTTVHPDLT